MNSIDLGGRIAAHRRAAGLTQVALAQLMGTKQPAISRVEAGQLPSLEFLERFAEATGQPFTLEFGRRKEEITRAERRTRVRRILGPYRFDPWKRQPTEAEARTLIADGLTRERFEGTEAAAASGR